MSPGGIVGRPGVKVLVEGVEERMQKGKELFVAGAPVMQIAGVLGMMQSRNHTKCRKQQWVVRMAAVGAQELRLLFGTCVLFLHLCHSASEAAWACAYQCDYCCPMLGVSWECSGEIDGESKTGVCNDSCNRSCCICAYWLP